MIRFFIHTGSNKVFASPSFARRGEKIPYMKSNQPGADAAALALDVCQKIVSKTRHLYGATEAVTEALEPLGYKVVFVKGDYQYTDRFVCIKV